MSQGGYVTLVGFVAQDPNLRPVTGGRNVTNLRVGATRRYQDKATGQWRDLETSYYNVACWNRLADHVRASMRKGDPVLVKGQFKTHSYEDKTGQIRTEIDIMADTVGHDLSRGVANYIRQRPPQQSGEDADGTSGGSAGGDFPEHRDFPGVAAEPGEMIDEEAIEQFGRDLDADLDQAERVVQALNGDEEAGASAPF
jgi:single-strand DNA-binding protein